MVMPIKLNKKANTSFTLDPEVIEIIDKGRGDISRSEFVNNLILERFTE